MASWLNSVYQDPSALGKGKVLSSICIVNNTEHYPAHPDPVAWIAEDFGQCCYTGLQVASFYIGWTSILCWIFAQFPQIYKNYKNGRADSLSWIFLFEWLVGDVTNLLGTIFGHQLAPQLYTAVYFVTMDVVMGSQWIYYNQVNKRKARLKIMQMSPKGSVNTIVPDDLEDDRMPLLPNGNDSGYGSTGGKVAAYGAGAIGLVMLSAQVAYVWSQSTAGVDSALSSSWSQPMLTYTGRSLLQDIPVDDGCHVKLQTSGIGYWLGWVSAAFYLGSRVPQIVKNFRRKDTDGLSPLLFTFAVLGNTTYGLGIFMYCTEGVFLQNHLPWLVGSVGTLMFDFTILCQTFYFTRLKRRSPKLSSELAPHPPDSFA